MGAFLREKPTAMSLPVEALEPKEDIRGNAAVPLPFFAPFSSTLIPPTGL